MRQMTPRGGSVTRADIAMLIERAERRYASLQKSAPSLPEPASGAFRYIRRRGDRPDEIVVENAYGEIYRFTVVRQAAGRYRLVGRKGD